jgi:hypothetical protein
MPSECLGESLRTDYKERCGMNNYLYMSMEQMGGFEDRAVLLGNQMQLDLALLHGEDLGMFIENHAAEFRDIIQDHPEFLDEFAEQPEQTLKKIEPLLYH